MDHRGSIYRLTDSNENVVQYFEYDAWGNVRRNEGSHTCRLMYQSNWLKLQPGNNAHPHYLSRSGRIYDATLGRYLSRDPAFDTPVYHAFENNPVNVTDPEGAFPTSRSQIRRIQRIVGTNDDGIVGPKTRAATRGFQEWLVEQGHGGDLGAAGVDGDFGPATARALQRFLISKGELAPGQDDGIIGPVTEGAWNQWVMTGTSPADPSITPPSQEEQEDEEAEEAPEEEAEGEQGAATTFTVRATREGLIGGTTASGHVIRECDVFVALPDRSALGRTVVVTYNGVMIEAPVLDVGPWSTRDPYWTRPNGRPLSESGRRVPSSLGGTPRNNAGIDLSDGLWDALGIPRGTGIVTVTWHFRD